jgi:phosphoglycolate phosphatase/pyrophosphatase PpaX
MLRYPCLVLDHDDTVVQSEATLNYPCFCEILDRFRPGETISLPEYIRACSRQVFADMCRSRYGFTDEELQEEYQIWKDYIRNHTPASFPGIERIIRRQKEEGGLVCVVSLSGTENILRDYKTHFGIIPDAIYSWDLPQALRKPGPYPLKHIMETYGLEPAQLLVVDDMCPGVQMAREAGVPVAFAAWSRLDYPEIMEEMQKISDFTFRNIQKLEEFLFWEEKI